MKNLLAVFIALLFFQFSCQSPSIDYPQPTDTVVKEDMEEKGKSEARKKWFEELHRSAPEVDWRSVEYQTYMKKHEERSALRSQNRTRGGDLVSVGNDQLRGRWKERGSSNQAGNVIATEYDVETNKVYTIGGGGPLFRSDLDGLSWEVVNQDVRLDGRLLKIFKHNDQKRMIGLINRFPHYSDDMGLTWTPSEGILISDRWGNCWHSVFEPNSKKIYLISKPTYWSKQTIYVSNDHGESYQLVQELRSHDAGLFHFFVPANGDDVFFVEKLDDGTWNLFKMDQAVDTLTLIRNIDEVGFIESRANLAGVKLGDNYRFYIYNSDKGVWQSQDSGMTWLRRGKFEGNPWSVGLFVIPSQPNILLIGEVECYRSNDSGRRWSKVNRWGEYYSDVYYKLHADMMYFNEFEDQDGDPFVLISNHGGLSITRNGGELNENIGLYGLNVSQYYSVRTDPLNSDIIYAGAQDQGFQRGKIKSTDWVEFDQVISGDYGHIIFTDSGKRMWTVYPGGSVSYYHNPHTEGRSLGFNIDSDDESVWIPPLVPHPDSRENAIYMAGGNINGGEGSHVIKAEVINGQIELSQWETDFTKISNDGRVGYIAFSPVDPKVVFVSTNNGFAFFSTDGGQSFQPSNNRVAGSHYLYGTSIIPSKFNKDIVYLGGSGYSTSPVVVSRNGGLDYVDMSAGLPPTVVFQLVSNADETVIYAATESGPYAYIAADNQWYDISGIDAPNQTYWSVEYLEDKKTARFGTYGRGIWDFNEEALTSTKDIDHHDFSFYPNPVEDEIVINSSSKLDLQLIDLSGKVLGQWNAMNQERINLDFLSTGQYILKSKYSSKKLIKK